MTRHEHDWTWISEWGRRCPCGAEEFEFPAGQWPQPIAHEPDARDDGWNYGGDGNPRSEP